MKAKERYKRVSSAYRECINAGMLHLEDNEFPIAYVEEMWRQFSDMCTGMGSQIVDAAISNFWAGQRSFEHPSGLLRIQMLRKREHDHLPEAQS